MNEYDPSLSVPILPLENVAIRLTDAIPPGPPDVIPGFLPRHGALVIAGETDIGKSLVALEVCSSLTTGVPLWGHIVPNLQAKRILYVLGEHHDAVIQRLWGKTKLPMSENVFLLGPEALGFDKWLVVGGKPSQLAVEKFKRWADKVDLIVWDPLSAFIAGGDGTENDNLHMRMLLDQLSGIAHTTGAACIILAHQGKPSINKDGVETKRTRYAIRGASGIEDAATNIFYMGHAANEALADHKLPEGVKCLEMVKRKYKGEAPDKYVLMRNPDTLVHTMLSNRPYTDIQAFDAQAMLGKILGAADVNRTTAVNIIAALKGVREHAVWDYLKRNLQNGNGNGRVEGLL